MRPSPSDTAGIQLYDEYMMLNPAVDERFAQTGALNVDGAITDAALWKAYIEEWAEWYREVADLDADLLRAVAFTVSDRVEDVDGDAKAAIVHALRIQEPLIQNADVAVIAARLDRVD